MSKLNDLNMNNEVWQGAIEMHLAAEPFEKIKSGKKTIEIRLFDEKRQQIRIGDKLVFTLVNNAKEIIKAHVIGLHRFNSFKELFASELFSKTGCTDMTVDMAAEGMYRYYSKPQEQKYGVLGIEMQLE